ncbi:MAG: hypothetical protein CL693_21015 [Cellvibrionaceae bacterium]|nr:hypothetical protein [Cellvibrionaceae bacterium]
MISIKDLQQSYHWQRQNLERLWLQSSNYSQDDESIKSCFSSAYQSVSEKLDALTLYFWQANQHYRNPHNTAVYYPGMGSIYGAKSDGMEGMSRLLPLWSAYYLSPTITDAVTHEIKEYFQQTITRGTDPKGSAYWGDITDGSTLICEAADIALAIWLVKDCLWHEFPDEVKHNALHWLGQARDKKTADNNWHLFIVLIDAVVTSLDSSNRYDCSDRYSRIKSFYLDQGCFKDGDNGDVDLYNAWGFHYNLYWIDQIDPEFDRSFIRQAVCDYSDWYQYLFTKGGSPLFGRSLSYRMAMPVPILAANHYSPIDFPNGTTLNTLYSCWNYYIQNDALKLGRPTQGVFEDNPTWLDPYSGPASAFWSTRSLVLHFYRSQDIDWTKTELIALPAESEKRTLEVASANMRITTIPSDKKTQVEFLKNNEEFQPQSLKSATLKDRLRSLILGISQRPSNNLLKHSIRVFDSNLRYYR